MLNAYPLILVRQPLFSKVVVYTTRMNVAAIDCQKLSKRYGRSGPYALKDLTIQVKPGEVYGFLGPNGAGKSTTIRTLMNFLQPTGGSASILGLDVVNDSVDIKRRVGYLSGEFSLYKDLTGKQYLDYMDSLQANQNQSRRKELVKMFEAQLDKPAGGLSKGNRQKLGLIQAFMHKPDVLILDEPTSGLDPLMQEQFFRLVKAAKADGAALFISSHNLSEVLRMCDRVGFIREGKLVAEKSIADLQTKAAHSFTITFKGEAPIDKLKKLKGLEITGHSHNVARVRLNGKLPPFFKALSESDVQRLDQDAVNLEEQFMQFYEETTK